MPRNESISGGCPVCHRAQHVRPPLTSDPSNLLPSSGQVGTQPRGPGAGRADWAGELSVLCQLLAANLSVPQHRFRPSESHQHPHLQSSLASVPQSDSQLEPLCIVHPLPYTVLPETEGKVPALTTPQRRFCCQLRTLLPSHACTSRPPHTPTSRRRDTLHSRDL